MKPSGEEEYQRFLGFRAPPWRWCEPGNRLPDSEGKGIASNLPLRHPIAWFRWRIAVRRQGPYAPDFNDFRRGTQTDSA